MILNLAFYYSVTYLKFICMRDKPRECLNVFSVSGFGTRQTLFGMGAQECKNITTFSQWQFRTSQ